MKKILSVITFIALLLLAITGCENDPNTLLTSGVWDFENMTTDSENTNIQTTVAHIKAAYTDATLEFQEGGDYIVTSPLFEEPITGTWSLVGEDQLIMNEDDGFTSTANIESISKKELKYLETYMDQEMNPYNVTTTWVRD